MNLKNIPERLENLRVLLDKATRQFWQNKAFFNVGGDGYTFQELGEKVVETAEMLASYGVEPGDRVGLVGQNSPNWVVAYFACVAYGYIVVPMLPDFSESELKHILKHSEAKALFVSDKIYPRIKEKARDRLSLIVSLDGFKEIKTPEKVENPLPLIGPEQIKAEDLASIIYTSGTTGKSKGVMLSHKNLCTTLRAAQILRPGYEWDVWLSILPLSHTLECSLSMLLPMMSGSCVYFLEKAPTPSILMKAFQTVRPTTMLSVPLIIEKIYRSAVLPTFQKNAVTRTLYAIPPFRKLLNRIAGKKLMEKFGGRIRFFGIGGAKLDSEVERFLAEAKFPYAIGYGLTETSPLVAGAAPEMVRWKSTGPAVYGTEVKLINLNENGEGEIVCRGDNVMMGYYKNEEATAETFTPDGWFRTKDLGAFDKDGWLYIKGRVGNMILGPSGENIYPEEIESVINSHELVEESLVKENKGRLEALVHFNKEKLNAWLDEKMESFEDYSKEAKEKLEELKAELIQYVNEKVSKFSRISTIHPQEDEFEKTATKKIKRYLYTNKENDSKESKDSK